MLFFIFYEFLSLVDKFLDFLYLGHVYIALLKFFVYLVIFFKFIDLYSLLDLVQVVFEQHYTFSARLLTNNKFVTIYLL